MNNKVILMVAPGPHFEKQNERQDVKQDTSRPSDRCHEKCWLTELGWACRWGP